MWSLIALPGIVGTRASRRKKLRTCSGEPAGLTGGAGSESNSAPRCFGGVYSGLEAGGQGRVLEGGECTRPLTSGHAGA